LARSVVLALPSTTLASPMASAGVPVAATQE
jgi:hypothetical protein